MSDNVVVCSVYNVVNGCLEVVKFSFVCGVVLVIVLEELCLVR